jgi:hypothetical protein
MTYPLHMNLPDAYGVKLEALAKHRRRSVEQCILDWIDASITGPSGWEPPEKAKPLKSSPPPPEPKVAPGPQDMRYLLVEGGQKLLQVAAEDGQLDAPRIRRAINALKTSATWRDHPRRVELLATAERLLALVTKPPTEGV